MWLAFFLFLGASSVLGQERAFDVASVKAGVERGRPNSNIPMGAGDAFTPTGGYFSATNFPLVSYIAFAYKVSGVQAQSIQRQLPEWALREPFDIQARVDGNPTKDEFRLLMRRLLAQRFKLEIHSETKDVPIAALVVAKEGKLGPQLRAHPADEECPLNAPPGATTEDGRFPMLCGGLVQMQPSVPRRLKFGGRNITLDFIASALSAGASSGRPLVDRTGLAGRFDFSLEFVMEMNGPAKTSGEEEQPGPSFESALREQLGLKVESQTGPVSLFVIDHVEKPSAN